MSANPAARCIRAGAGAAIRCGEWNCIAEESGTKGAPLGGKSKGRRSQTGGHKIDFVSLDHKLEPAPRRLTGISEFDRVTGGGLVPGSALLIGGDPGIGKSTLLLQVVASLGSTARCAYISGEEAVDQIQLRASRLGVQQAPLELAAATDMASILVSLDSLDRPDVVVIDSIQTMYIEALESAPGTGSQVRACAQEIIRLAKERGFTVLLVGHVTKDGRSPARGCSSTWSIRCSISRASAAISSASCARSRTASARPTRSASSK